MPALQGVKQRHWCQRAFRSGQLEQRDEENGRGRRQDDAPQQCVTRRGKRFRGCFWIMEFAHRNTGGLFQSVHVGDRQAFLPHRAATQRIAAAPGKNSIRPYGEQPVKDLCLQPEPDDVRRDPPKI